jgi:hypothetical protein
MKRMIHSKQVRRRSDGSIGIEFYRRHAVTLRGELIARSLSVTCREVRHWAATTTWLVQRGGRLRWHGMRVASFSKRQTIVDIEYEP